MVYRGWKINAYRSFLGHSAQYVSPIGQIHQAGGGFPTDEQAVAYAQALVDQMLERERLGFSAGDDTPRVTVA